MAALSTNLRVLTYNILAPVFVTASEYPVDPALLARDARWPIIFAYLQSVIDQFDVFCLQEVEETIVPFLVSVLGGAFVSHFEAHDPSHWSGYYDAAHPYVANGNMVFIRKSKVSGSVTFGAVVTPEDGAHHLSAEFTTVNGKRVQLFCVHLDSDVGGNRKKELLDIISAFKAGYEHIVCGDWNCNTDVANLQKILKSGNIRDGMKELGPLKDVATHPFTDKYNDNPVYGAIDRVAISKNIQILYDSMVFSIIAATDTERISACLRLYGTDHYPVFFNLVVTGAATAITTA